MPRISTLPQLTALADGDLFVVVDASAGATKRVTAEDIAAYVGGGGSSYLEDFYVHVNDYGAVPDYVVATGVGTDSTVGIQAAVDDTAPGAANAGKTVLIGPGHYLTTGPIELFQGTELSGMNELRTGAVGSQGNPFSTTLHFKGGATDNCIEALGGPAGSVSRVKVSGFKIVDRRVTATSGSGVFHQRSVNQVVVRNMDIGGFPGGSSIWVTSQTGSSSDCVVIEDIWISSGTTGYPWYGIRADHIDNQLLIRDIKIDTPNLANAGLTQIAGIHVSAFSAACLIEGVKHENSNESPTIIVGATNNTTNIRGVVSRIGQGHTGPMVRFDGHSGTSCVVENIWRQNGGAVLDAVNSTMNFAITGNRVNFWTGGADGVRINTAALVGDTGTGVAARILLAGQFHASNAGLTTGGTNTAKMAVRPDGPTNKALVVQGAASQTADVLDVQDSAGNNHVSVSSAGKFTAHAAATIGGAASTVGGYGSAGATKGSITGDVAADPVQVLRDLLAYWDARGWLTDATT